MDDNTHPGEFNAGNLIYNIKLTPPLLPKGIVHRGELLEQLFQGIRETPQFTLISASLGYGKTTLVADWVEKLNIPYVWITLSPEDNDPGLLLQYLSTGIKEINTESGEQIEKLLNNPPLPPPDRLGILLSQWVASMKTPLPLILDDYHLIHNPGIHQLIRSLLKNMPRNLNLVLMTREDPCFGLGRLRVANQLLEIRAEDLEFREEEIRHFIGHFTKEELDKPMLDIISAKTEGWAASLQLLGLSLRRSSRQELRSFIDDFDGTNQYIIDYLLEEVLQDRSEEELDFLAKSALFDSFCADLCDCIRGSSNSARLIHTLKKDNLFIITLDPRQKWYRYHNLFAGFMKSRLQEEEKRRIYKQASLWFRARNLNVDAVKYEILANEENDQGEAGGNYESGGRQQQDSELSRREREILSYINAGLSNKEIGEKLFISTGTVKWHINNIFTKMHVKSRTQALYIARQRAWFSPQTSPDRKEDKNA